MEEPECIDFGSAELFLIGARAAFEAGDRAKFIACRKLLCVALGINDEIDQVGFRAGRQHLPAKRSPAPGAA